MRTAYPRMMAAVAVLCLVASAVFLVALVVQPPWLIERLMPSSPTPLPTATATHTPIPTASPSPTPTLTPSPTPVPQFGSITFGIGVSGDQVQQPGSVFPAGTQTVYAVWSYRNMHAGTPYTVAWLLDDLPWQRESLPWDADVYGTSGPCHHAQISAPRAEGLPPGNYRLELYIGLRQVQVATFSVLAPTPTPPAPSPTPRPDMQQVGRNAARSLVRLQVETNYKSSSGSGSVVDAIRGLILTAWHVVQDGSDESNRAADWVAVYLADHPGGLPRFAYWAQVLTDYSDPDADLAMLRITHRGVDNSPVEGPLDLPAIGLGDAEPVVLGDSVLLLGYPDYAEGTLSWTQGEVAALTDEWIKTSAVASYGHSGGMLVNKDGLLIGVPVKVQRVGVGGELCLAVPIHKAARLVAGATGWNRTPSAAPTQAPFTAERMVVLGTPRLNLRDGPGMNYSKLTEMPLGTGLDVLQQPTWDGERNWYHVRIVDSGMVGWASEVFLGSWSEARTPIVFSSNRAGDYDLYRIYPDGQGLQRLTLAAGDEGDASWSPDRRRIVFVHGVNGNSDISTMNADGGVWSPLLLGPANDIHPVWSPDGTRVAFASDRDGDWEIYMLELNSGTIRQLTFNDGWDSFPAWSRDGLSVAFTSKRTGNYDLFLVDTATGQETQLTNNVYSDAHPAWVPRTDQILYTMVLPEGYTLLREIGVLNVRNPWNPRRLTVSQPGQALNGYPDSSPNGRWMVFVSEAGGDQEIYVAPAAGGPTMANLTQSPGSNDNAPAWAR